MTGPAIVNILAAVPRTNPSACVKLGRSVFCRNGSTLFDTARKTGIYSRSLMLYYKIKRGYCMKLKILVKIVEKLLGMTDSGDEPRADMFLPERLLAMSIVFLA